MQTETTPWTGRKGELLHIVWIWQATKTPITLGNRDSEHDRSLLTELRNDRYVIFEGPWGPARLTQHGISQLEIVTKTVIDR